MAIIGEIFIIIVGLILLFGGAMCAYYISRVCGGREVFGPLIAIIAGLAIVYAACHYGPISITIK